MKHSSKMVAWNVFLDGRLIETVFYTGGVSMQDVLTDLIECDGYSVEIEVEYLEEVR